MKIKCCKMEIGLWKLYAIDKDVKKYTVRNYILFVRSLHVPRGKVPQSLLDWVPVQPSPCLLYFNWWASGWVGPPIYIYIHVKIQHHDSLKQTIIRPSKHMFHNYLNLQEKAHILILIFILCFIIGYYSHF